MVLELEAQLRDVELESARLDQELASVGRSLRGAPLFGDVRSGGVPPSAPAEPPAPRAAIPGGPLVDWRAISTPSGLSTVAAAEPTPGTTLAECPQS